MGSYFGSCFLFESFKCYLFILFFYALYDSFKDLDLYQSSQGLYIKKGGLLKDNEQFTGLTPGETVTVKTNKGSYQAKSVVFACGPWTNKALSSLNVKLPIAVSAK